MPNSLGLAGDGDDSHLVLNLEASFAVRFSDAELKGWRTVGDVYGALPKYFSGPRHGPRRCATAMVFYRLRRAFSDLGIDVRLGPESHLKQIRTLSAKALFRELETRTNLRLPRAAGTLLGSIGGFALFSAIFVSLGVGVGAAFGIVPYSLLLVPVAMATIGHLLLRLDPEQIPAEYQTLGDLAHAAAALSFARLVANGAGARDKDLWQALVEVLAAETGFPKSEIRPETLLIG